MSILETAVEELKTLPAHKLAEAVRFIHGLREQSESERLAALEQSGGSLSMEEAEVMESALADCRQIDRDEW